MRTLALQTVMELRLLLRLRWPLLLPLAAGAWMILETRETGLPASMDVNLYAASAHDLLMIFVPMVPILLGVYLMRRDTLNTAYEWGLALPVTNRVFITSKWMAGFVYSSMFTLCIQAAYLIAAWQHALPWKSALKQILIYTSLYESSFAICLALGMVLGALMPMRFSLPIAFCGWVFGTLFVPMFLVEVFNWHPANMFSLNPLELAGGTVNEAWTFQLRAEEFRLKFAINAAFTLFMLTAAAAVLARSRPVLRPQIPNLVMWTALLTALASLVPYAGLWGVRYETINAVEAAAAPPEQAQPQEPFMFRIDRLALEVHRNEDDRLDLKATVDLPLQNGALIPAAPGIKKVKEHAEGVVSFLLYPRLTVQSLAIDGRSVPFEQKRDLVSFERDLLGTGSGTRTLVFTYTGTLHEWEREYTRQYYRAFVDGRQVFLPGYNGWFPIPGGDSLLYKSYRYAMSRTDTLQYMQADIDVRMTGFPGDLFTTIPPAPDDGPGSRHWSQKSAGGLTILGGSFETVRIDGEPISIVTTPGNVEESKLFLERINEQRIFYEDWIGEPLNRLKQIVYFPMDDTMRWSYGNNLFIEGHTLFINEMTHNNLDNYKLQQVMTYLLFGDTVSTTMPVNEWDDKNQKMADTYSIVQELREAIVPYVWLAESLPADERLNMHHISPLHKTMHEMINNAYAAGKQDLVRRVLLRFYDQGLYIKDPYSVPFQPIQFSEHDGRFKFPVITWKQWLKVWNEEKGR
ncbi:hypothetical protein [Paenibacillus spongiae]|uniref:ABC transporter permease n=1 Tax=Paenibacillus spongiae TaxID=2909671 RepID=A0ABY5S4B9_9BACL|nr:hypothetical protein [Paenibacillus spongiae]UVI28731.1 hypothetical protein L1F29_25315 [Paenibacillus spongiae]